MATLVLDNIPESVNQALLSAYPEEFERKQRILSLLTQFAQNEQQKGTHVQRFDETRILTANELIDAVGVTTDKKASIDDMSTAIFLTL